MKKFTKRSFVGVALLSFTILFSSSALGVTSSVKINCDDIGVKNLFKTGETSMTFYLDSTKAVVGKSFTDSGTGSWTVTQVLTGGAISPNGSIVTYSSTVTPTTVKCEYTVAGKASAVIIEADTKVKYPCTQLMNGIAACGLAQ